MFFEHTIEGVGITRKTAFFIAQKKEDSRIDVILKSEKQLRRSPRGKLDRVGLSVDCDPAIFEPAEPDY